jgi:hypothetical protein
MLAGMLIALLPILCILVGVLMMVLSAKEPINWIGRCLVLWGLGLTIMLLGGAHRWVRLG